jgi:hypothetical protein
MSLFCIIYAVAIAAQSLTGTVFDDPFPLKRASMPVGNAVVYLSLYNADQKGRFETVEQIIAAGLLDSTITGQLGTYQFENLSTEAYIVSVKHPDFRSSPQMVYVTKDTTAYFLLVSSNAAAEVVGHVQHKKADGAGFSPVPACTVSVRKAFTTQLTLDDLVPPKPPIKVVTDSNGYFSVTDIPITKNGEAWAVSATWQGTSQSVNVDCYNSSTDTADIIFCELYANSASVNFGGATFTLSVSKYEYHWNELAELRYSITNPTSSPITFDSFSDGCEYDFIVNLDNGIEIYRESVARICVAMISSITVDPGETVTHTFSPFDISEKLSAIRKDTLWAPHNVKVNFQARLMGAKYNSTLVEVPVTIYFDVPVGTVALPKNRGDAAVSFNAAQNTLIFNSAQPQSIAVRIYSLNGAVLPHYSTQQQLSAGIQTLSMQGMLNNRAPGRGSYIIEVRGESFEKRFFRVNLTR